MSRRINSEKASPFHDSWRSCCWGSELFQKGYKGNGYGTQGEGQIEPGTKKEINGVVSRSLARWVENRSREISFVYDHSPAATRLQ